MNVLMISYGKNFFQSENNERHRMIECAQKVDSLHAVVFSHQNDNCANENINDSLFLYPTQSRNSVFKVLDAIRISRRIIKDSNSKNWVITAQDPFEAGLVGIVVSKLCRVPVNIQEHGDFFSTHYWRNESTLNKIRFFYGKYILRLATTVRVVSDRISRTVSNLDVHPERILKLSVETDIQNYQSAAADSSLIPNYSPEHTYILSMARFVPQKNLPLLIRAFTAIRSRFPKARLVLVGQGQEEQYLRELAAENNAIIFLPWCEQPAALLKSVSMYALSSNYEGWGRVLIEAQAAGLPIITTDVGCVGEAVIKSDSVEVVPIASLDQYAAALDRLLRRLPTATQKAKEKALTTKQGSEVSYANSWQAVLSDTQAFKV